jgi:hypothetical protein
MDRKEPGISIHMASDLALVLPSAHRRLRARLERCTRPARGMDDPDAELARELAAHTQAAVHEIYRAEGLVRLLPEGGASRLTQVAQEVQQVLAGPSVDPARLARLTTAVISTEEALLLPVLQDAMPLPERRRLGKVYRLRRDAALRAAGPARRHRTASHSELYERARRAGVSQRSRMTVAELEQALRAQPEPPA